MPPVGSGANMQGQRFPVRRIAAVQKLRQQRYRLLEGQSRRADEPCASCEQVAV